jgi:type VI secretion system protein ImpK
VVRQKGIEMSGDGSSDGGGNRTVFRPSPLAGIRSGQPAAPPPPAPAGGGFAPPPAFGAPPFGSAPLNQSAFGTPPLHTPAAQSFEAPPAGYTPPQQMPSSGGQRLNDDDIPVASLARDSRSPLVMEAGPVLALAASIRSGRARISMPDFHREASESIAAYDRAIAPLYPDEVRQRARYALCSTIDDIAQNLPSIGQDGAEWARRSLVVQFFRENIGGDRFWQLVDDLLQRPAQNAELIELFTCCLAAGFEGRFRVMPDGRSRLQQIMSSLYGALEHPRALSGVELSPQWKGADAPLAKVSMWNRVLFAAALAAAVLLLIFIVLRLLLMTAGSNADRLTGELMPKEQLRLSRVGTPPPVPAESGQLTGLRKFLEPEIRQKLVVVDEDASDVRVRTTVGQLFKSGSDQLEPGRAELFERIGRAVEGEPGQITIEGHADSDKFSSLAFPDNVALSTARAKTVSGIISSALTNPGRISVQGFGDSRPIASNDTAEGKSQNRRVEIVIPRHQ